METSNREYLPKQSEWESKQQTDSNKKSLFSKSNKTSKKPFFGPSHIQAKLFIGDTNDAAEQEANQHAEGYVKNENHQSNWNQVSNEQATIQRSVQSQGEHQGILVRNTALEQDLSSSKGKGQTLDVSSKKSMESYFNADFSKVRIHTDENAQQLNQKVGAHAFTHGSDVYFNKGQYSPGSNEGKKLLAHELTHVVQQRPSNQINRVSGQDAQDRVTELINQHQQMKDHRDVVKNALREIKAKKSVSYNKQAIIKDHLPQLSVLLVMDLPVSPMARIMAQQKTLTDLTTEWTWLADHVGDKTFAQKEDLFMDKLNSSTISTTRENFPKSIMHDKIKYSDTSVFDLIIKHADADIDAEQLYAYASNEGLSDLIKKGQEVGVTGKDLATKVPISGFGVLGMDDFVSDFEAKRKPVKDYLPKGFERNFVEVPKTNEKKRKVRSADFINLDTALQAMKASFQRKRDLFLEDAANNGYAKPSIAEKVYWTYLYYNPGEFGGKAQLEKYKKGNTHKQAERKLSDWITKGEYADAQRVLQGYQTIVALKIFK